MAIVETKSALAQITEQLEKIAAIHGFTAISIGLNTKQAPEYRYDCSLHFDDANEGELKCALGSGPTMARAINEANRQSLARRTRNSILVEEAA